MRTDAVDPGDVRTFTLDYVDLLTALGGDVVITDSSWEVPVELTKVADDKTSTTTSIKLDFANATIGTDYVVYNRIATDGDDARRRALIIPVRDAATFSPTSNVKATLDAIRAALAKNATRAQLRRSIGDKSIEFMSVSELLVAETRFQQLYNQQRRAEKARQGAPFLKNLHARFVPPS
jgi:hypothetical protein